MAKEEKKAEAPAAAGKEKKPKKHGKMGVVLFMVIFGISFWFIFPTLVLFMLGMSPTFIALITDNDRNKSGAAAVGAMNAAGVTPFIIDLWMKDQTMGTVFQILRDPSSWLVMLGAAAIGQLIFFAVPQAVALLTMAGSEARLKLLRSNLESLKDVWGADVGTTKSPDKVGRSE